VETWKTNDFGLDGSMHTPNLM